MHCLHPLVLADVEVIVLGNLAVILQRFFARRLLQRVVKGMSPISSSSGVVKKTMFAG